MSSNYWCCIFCSGTPIYSTLYMFSYLFHQDADIDVLYKSYSASTRQSLDSWSGSQLDLGLVCIWNIYILTLYIYIMEQQVVWMDQLETRKSGHLGPPSTASCCCILWDSRTKFIFLTKLASLSYRWKQLLSISVAMKVLEQFWSSLLVGMIFPSSLINSELTFLLETQTSS